MSPRKNAILPGAGPTGEEEEKLRTIIESVPNGIVMVDTRGKITLCNSEVEKMFGYEKNELLGREIEILVPIRLRKKHPEYRDAFFDRPSKRQMGAGRDLSGVMKDGTEIPVEIGLNHVKTQEGIYIIATIVDISERQRSEERYRLFVDSVRDYAIFMLSTDGKILSWNAGAQRVKGYSADEVIGNHFSMFYNREEILESQPETELSIASKQGRFETEGWRVRKDGSRFWANVVITALRDSSGKLQGFGKVTRDLTERKKQEERFRTIVESVPNGLILVDTFGMINLCNSDTEKMFGYEREELLGRPIELLVPKRFQPDHPRFRDSYIAHPQKRQMGAGRDLMGLRKDDTEFPVEIGLNPMQTPEGNFVLASVVDITERKGIEAKLHKAYQEVQQKNEEMEQFVYTVSHDLKAPLVTSTSFISFLKEDIAAKRYEEVADSLSRLDKAHHKMQDLISDLLQVSRLGRMDLELENIDLNEVFSEVLDATSQLLEEKSVKIEISTRLPLVFADRKRMFQVFENLITNAVKYGAHDSSKEKPAIIKVLWVESDSEFQIGIKDNGPGIEKQYHKKIFGLFQRLHTDREGTGVGLTIVSRIMSLHSGKVWVVSDLGQGAEFWISLPKLKGEKYD